MQPQIQTLEAEIPAKSEMREEHKTTNSTSSLEVKLVTCINRIRMYTDGKGEEQRGAQYIMGSLIAV